jgi:hypothetical protein
MNNSNWSLRFPRSSREAFGHQAQFQERDPDRIVGWAAALMAAFVFGLILGGL